LHNGSCAAGFDCDSDLDLFVIGVAVQIRGVIVIVARTG